MTDNPTQEEMTDLLKEMKDAWNVNADATKARNIAASITIRWPKLGGAEIARQFISPIDFHTSQPVKIVRVDMPFWHIVGFMVKWAIAAIPAIFVVAFIYAVINAITAVPMLLLLS